VIAALLARFRLRIEGNRPVMPRARLAIEPDIEPHFALGRSDVSMTFSREAPAMAVASSVEWSPFRAGKDGEGSIFTGASQRPEAPHQLVS